MTLPTATAVAYPQAEGFDAQLDDLLLRLFVGPRTPLQFEDAPVQANRVQTSVDREEFVSDFGEVFARSDFTGGEGLDWAHRPNQGPTDPQRFWDSRGIDVERREPGRRRQLGLLSDTERILALTDPTLDIVSLAGVLFVTDGTQVQRCDDPTGAAAWVVESPHGAKAATDVAGLAVLGDEVYAALGANGVHRRDSAGVWTHYSGLTPAGGVWGAQGRVFVSTGRSLYEVTDATPTPATALRTLAPGQSWVDVIDAGEAILGAASDGYVYAWTVDDVGALVLAQQSLFQNETPTCLGESQGQVFVGTSQGGIGRLWKGGLQQGQFSGHVVREWTTGAPRSIVADRETVFTAVANAGETHVWRYEQEDDARFRHHVYKAAGDTTLALVDGALFGAVGGSGVWRATTTFVASGYLIGPLADFFSADKKLWVGSHLDVGDIPEGTRVELWFSTDPDALTDSDHASWVRVRNVASVQDLAGEAPMTNVEGRQATMMLRLYTDSTRLLEPTTFSFGLRAYPSEPDEIVTLPVNVSDLVPLPGRVHLRVPGRGAEVQAALEARKGRSTLLQVFNPPKVVRGIIESVGTPIPVLAPRGSRTYYSLVRVRGRRTSLSGWATEGAFGTFMFGAATFGGSDG